MERKDLTNPLEKFPVQVVRFTPDQIAGIKCMGDFYSAVGLDDAIKGGEISSVAQVYMNKDECEGLEDIVLKNLKGDRRFRGFSDRYLKTSVAMDWLNYSPVCAEYIAPGEVWAISKEYEREAMECHREYAQRKDKEDDACQSM